MCMTRLCEASKFCCGFGRNEAYEKKIRIKVSVPVVVHTLSKQSLKTCIVHTHTCIISIVITLKNIEENFFKINFKKIHTWGIHNGKRAMIRLRMEGAVCGAAIHRPEKDKRGSERSE